MSAALPSVVIVDDHELFRAGVRAELEGLVDIRAEAGNGRGGGRARSCARSPTSSCSTSTCPAAAGSR